MSLSLKKRITAMTNNAEIAKETNNYVEHGQADIITRPDGTVLFPYGLAEVHLTTKPRRLTEIVDAIDFLFHQVWYNRHQVARQKIERGITKIVEKETFPVKDHSRRPVQRDVWEGALKAAAKVEKKYGLANLGPWDDFGWG